MKKISSSEITLSALALAIGALTAISAWAEHGSLGPFLCELGRGAMLCIFLWVAMNHASQRRHRETNGEILVRITGVDDKVEHVIHTDQQLASTIRDLVDRADEDDTTGPLPVIRRYNG